MGGKESGVGEIIDVAAAKEDGTQNSDKEE